MMKGEGNIKNEMSNLVDILHAEHCSCVIFKDGRLTICRERGVKDLYRILEETPDLLQEAMIADKVIGKGAAALMALGGVREVYADVISLPALELLKGNGIPVVYADKTANIIDRAGTGICPVETLCKEAATAEECLPLIREFINKVMGL